MIIIKPVWKTLKNLILTNYYEKPFNNTFNDNFGEGYDFCKYRENKIITIPSWYVIIAITHGKNYTRNSRSYDNFSHINKEKNQTNSNILDSIDEDDKEFILNLYKNQINL